MHKPVADLTENNTNNFGKGSNMVYMALMISLRMLNHSCTKYSTEFLSRYREEEQNASCNGYRLRTQTLCESGRKTYWRTGMMPVKDLKVWFEELNNKLSSHDKDDRKKNINWVA